jgi:hypothetical protein
MSAMPLVGFSRVSTRAYTTPARERSPARRPAPDPDRRPAVETPITPRVDIVVLDDEPLTSTDRARARGARRPADATAETACEADIVPLLNASEWPRESQTRAECCGGRARRASEHAERGDEKAREHVDACAALRDSRENSRRSALAKKPMFYGFFFPSPFSTSYD